MPPRPIVNDALWKCLCPGYQIAGTRARLAPAADAVARRRRSRSQLRTYTTAPWASESSFGQPANHVGSPRSSRHGPPSPINSRRSLREKVAPVHLPTAELYDRLRIDGAAGRYEEAMNTVRILIKDRRERPNARMYTALLHSFTNCEEGTAGKLRNVFEEMETAGVELDGRGAECVLEALAVHPDYLLRTDVLEYMRARWFTLSDRGRNFVVAGLLRDRLFEQGLEMLDDMVRQRCKVEGWLWDKAMWLLLEFEEVEEAFYVLSVRHSVEGQGVKLSNALWLQLLDAAGRKRIHEAANMIWNTQVVPGYIKPPTGTCLNILSIASRNGDVKLATDVFRVLADRDTVFTADHYEMLIACYLAANDLSAALSITVIMQDSGLNISTDVLHPLYTYLTRQDSRPMEAFAQLRELAGGNKKIPTAAVNACLQASIHLSNLAEAVEIYKALHTISKAGPNTATFNLLFQGCHKAGRKDLAMFLADEMAQLGVRPDRITYDRLILVCLNAGDLDGAFLYYEEMRAARLLPRPGTHKVLIERALQKGDERCVAVLKEFKENVQQKARAVALERKVGEKFDEGGKVREGAVDALERMRLGEKLKDGESSADALEKISREGRAEGASGEEGAAEEVKVDDETEAGPGFTQNPVKAPNHLSAEPRI